MPKPRVPDVLKLLMTYFAFGLVCVSIDQLDKLVPYFHGACELCKTVLGVIALIYVVLLLLLFFALDFVVSTLERYIDLETVKAWALTVRLKLIISDFKGFHLRVWQSLWKNKILWCSLLLGLSVALNVFLLLYPSVLGNWEKLFESVSLRDKTLGDAEQLTKTGVAFSQQGKFESAESCFKQALEIIRRVLGEGDVRNARIQSNLGGVFLVKGRYSDAETAFRNALKIRESKGDYHSLESLECVRGLAQSQFYQKRLVEAESLAGWSMFAASNAVKAGLNDQRSGAAASKYLLAVIYEEQGALGASETVLKRAIDEQEEMKQGGVFESIRLLMEVLNKQGKYDEALAAYSRAEKLLKSSTTKDKLVETLLCSEAAQTYDGKGDYTKAKNLFEHSVELGEFDLGPDSPYLVFVLKPYWRFLMDHNETVLANQVEARIERFDDSEPRRFSVTFPIRELGSP